MVIPIPVAGRHRGVILGPLRGSQEKYQKCPVLALDPGSMGRSTLITSWFTLRRRVSASCCLAGRRTGGSGPSVALKKSSSLIPARNWKGLKGKKKEEAQEMHKNTKEGPKKRRQKKKKGWGGGGKKEEEGKQIVWISGHFSKQIEPRIPVPIWEKKPASLFFYPARTPAFAWSHLVVALAPPCKKKPRDERGMGSDDRDKTRTEETPNQERKRWRRQLLGVGGQGQGQGQC